MAALFYNIVNDQSNLTYLIAHVFLFVCVLLLLLLLQYSRSLPQTVSVCAREIKMMFVPV